MIWTRCWEALGTGSGANGLSLRFFSRPPDVVVCCHAFIVTGGNFLVAIASLAASWDIELIGSRRSLEVFF